MPADIQRNDVEVLEKVDMADVAESKASDAAAREEIDDSFYIFDLGMLVDKYKLWTKMFPNIRPYYAFKACPYKPLLQALHALGAGFDCASKYEVQQIMDLGVDVKDVIFAHTMKQISHVQHAKEVGLKRIVFDSEDELVKIEEHYKEAQLVLRTVIANLKTEKNLSIKFGAFEEEGMTLLRSAKEKGLAVVGVSFYVTLVSLDLFEVESYGRFLEVCRRLFDYGLKIGFHMNLLDIGGGIPGYRNFDDKNILKIGQVINDALNDNFPKDLFFNLEIIAEPGQFFCTSPIALVTNVIGKKLYVSPTPDSQKENSRKFMYFLNDGSHGALKTKWITPYFKGFLTQRNKDVKHLSCLWGPTCDETDVVMDNVLMPELDNGDWVIWGDCGAYTYSTANSFNGFRTKVFYNVISKDHLKQLKSLSEVELKHFNFIEASERAGREKTE